MESDEESEELVYYQLIFGFLTCVQAFLYWRMFCVARSGDDETQLTAATACSSFMDVASLGRVRLAVTVRSAVDVREEDIDPPVEPRPCA